MNESAIPAPIVPKEMRATTGPALPVIAFQSAQIAADAYASEYPSNVPVPFVLAPPDAFAQAEERRWREDQEARKVPAQGFQKDDSVKAPLAMLPFEALAEVAKVMHYGAYRAPRPDGTKGYGRDNWRQCTDPERYESAEFRHYQAVQDGEAKDKESGLLHRAHKACDALFALQIELDAIRRGK